VTEAEILQGLFNAIGSVITIFSLFFTMVSAYLAALYLFLNRAPLALRLLAFVLLSLGLVFLGGSVAVIQTMQNGLFAAWDRLPAPAFSLREVRNPLGAALAETLPVTQQQIGVGIGWSVAIFVYLALGYLTFLYRWPHQSKEGQTDD
jgi:type IV secretory pathway TraG/TraD family ATPase VirD4